MQFELDEDLSAVEDLAREVFSAQATMDRVREVERSESSYDRALWTTLAETGLLGISIPEDHGGAGLGLSGLAVVLQEQGRHVAPVPLWSHAVAIHSLNLYAVQEDVSNLLADSADGSRRLSLALEEFEETNPAEPRCHAERDPDGTWRLTGMKALVPSPHGIAGVLVSANTADGAGLFLVDAEADLSWEFVPVTTHDVAGNLRLNNTAAIPIGVPGDDAVEVTLRAARIALAALQLGVCEGALAHAASYLTEREQFARPLGSFQAVQHQLADCWIDIEAIRVTLWQALSSMEEGEETAPAGRAALVAKWWSAEAGLDVVHRVQHVHGGMGVDIDYPVHRHFLWGKQIANTLGGAENALAALGADLPMEVGA